jgi:glyoxylase-like metal-dependent hydrolase (beta-lactamase superfamily II)
MRRRAGYDADMNDNVVIKQLLSGVDFATTDPYAGQMVNFVYLIADRQSGEALLVDPAWDIDGLLNRVESEGFKLTGILATHYHPDHIGGDLFGYTVQGLAGLKERIDVPVHVHRSEADGVRLVTGLSANDLALHDGDDVVHVGDVPVRLLHTPGHTPGSQCFLVGDRYLVSGDTLFVEGCGRVDLPGGDADEMFRTLTQRLAKLPDDLVLLPGHHYGARASAPLGEVRQGNPCLRIRNLEDWRRTMGAA